MAQQVFDLVGRQCLVDGHRDQSGVQDRQVGDLPLRPVGRPERHPIPRLEAFRDHGIAEPVHRPGVLLPVDRHPARARLEVQRGRIRALARRVLEERGYRFGQGGRLDDRLGRANCRVHAATIRELPGFE